MKPNKPDAVNPADPLRPAWHSTQHAAIVYHPSQMKIEIEREEDGRWIAEIPDLPGVLAYGATEELATAKAKAFALRVMADRLEHGEAVPDLAEVFQVAA